MPSILLMLTPLMMNTMKYSGFMKKALYNYKNFTAAQSLDDEPSDISEHGDFVWTVDPNNKPPI